MTQTALPLVFFLQMAVILGACRVVGWAAKRIGQPQVVGEMIAGVLLGPSLFGFLFPQLQKAVFPPESLDMLYVGAQLGVGLYMFLVGLEFDTAMLRRQAKSALAVSLAGMLVPLICALLLTSWLVKIPGLFSAKATSFEAFLFLGAAIAMTAFPMLARIIHERGLTGTSLGNLALAAGAVNDAAAGFVLILVLANFQKLPDGSMDTFIVIKAVGGGLLYALFISTVGRRIFQPLGALVEREGKTSDVILGVVLMCFCTVAWLMESLGLHAVLGGFLLGIAMPRGLFARLIQEKLELFTVVFLLPMFFTYSGLKTELSIVGDSKMLFVALILLAAAIFSKAFACWAAARFTGLDNRSAVAVGALMNARGMMGLIIANIGLQKGVIEPPLFAMLVLVALVTTLMVSPLFEQVYGRHTRAISDNEIAPGNVA